MCLHPSIHPCWNYNDYIINLLFLPPGLSRSVQALELAGRRKGTTLSFVRNQKRPYSLSSFGWWLPCLDLIDAFWVVELCLSMPTDSYSHVCSSPFRHNRLIAKKARTNLKDRSHCTQVCKLPSSCTTVHIEYVGIHPSIHPCWNYNDYIINLLFLQPGLSRSVQALELAGGRKGTTLSFVRNQKRPYSLSSFGWLIALCLDLIDAFWVVQLCLSMPTDSYSHLCFSPFRHTLDSGCRCMG